MKIVNCPSLAARVSRLEARVATLEALLADKINAREKRAKSYRANVADALDALRE